MNKIKYLITFLVLISGNLLANPTVDEKTIRAISVEMMEGIKNKDFSVVEKYMYPGTKILVDLDPAPDAGQQEISYDEYMNLVKMGLAMVDFTEIDDEILSLSVDKKNNQATIKEKTSTTAQMMGMEMKDVSVTKSVFGVVDDHIKILSIEDIIISSEITKLSE